MKEYSPYLQIQKINNSSLPLPALYLSSGLVDSRVPYWEPLKFIAQARSCLDEQSNSKIVIRIGPGGHFEANGLNQSAEWMAFLVDSLLFK
jgi:protease II